ncbi:MAG TPA: CHAD domain-containing protein [Burkholderiales bacterium]|nr:CHAD domain-containing protein [Burkholderiales bacterium]
MPTEVELKLRVAPEHVARLQRHPLLKTLCRAGPVRQKLYTVYYDTPDLDLFKHGSSLRLRRSGSRWLQTVKSGETARGGLYQRSEWESPVARQEPDFAAFQGLVLPGLFASSKLRRTLQPVFVTEFTRTTRLLQATPGEEVEFCLDRGEIRAKAAASPICEIELELKSGSPVRLFEMALELQKVIPLKLENASKALRGYRLYSGEAPAPAKAAAPSLAPSMNASDAFIAIVEGCVQHLQANETGMLKQGDPEYLHQMRVALRRMRSAFKVFSKILPEPVTIPLVEEIKWLGGVLGPARDWDVFYYETLLPVMEVFAEDPALRALREDCLKLREASRAAGRQAVDSSRYQRWLLLLGAFLIRRPWFNEKAGSAPLTATMPVAEFAQALLEKCYGRLIKLGRHLARLNERERHRLRIAAKKLRYTADFFSGLYLRKRARRYLKALGGLQDILGLLNDAATMRKLLDELSQCRRESRSAVNLISGWNAHAVRRQLQEMRRAWEECISVKVFWR